MRPVQDVNASLEKPFPTIALGLVSIAMFTNAFSLVVLFPFVGAMVQQLGLTDDPRELGTLSNSALSYHVLIGTQRPQAISLSGFYAGYIGAAFMVGRLCTSYVWGLYSDRYGRRPVMLVGMAGMVIFGVGFGLSFNFTWAIAMRVLTGMFNGIVGTGKTMVSELCTEQQQARGMSLVTATWGLGLVVGPAIGGLLAFPSDTMPSIFGTSGVWVDYPFFLPMLLSSVVAAAGLVPSILYLPETLPKEVQGTHEHECASPHFMLAVASCACFRRGRLAPLGSQGGSGGVELSAMSGSPDAKYTPLDEEQVRDGGECDTAADLEKGEGGVSGEGGGRDAVPPQRGLLRNSTVMLVVTMYAVWSMGNIMMNEVLPIWGLAPRSVGGLDISTAEIGGIMASIGVFLVLFQMLLYHRIAAYFNGPLYVFRASAVVWIVIVLVMPSASSVRGHWGRIIATAAFNCVRNALGTCAFTSIFMMINNSAPSAQRGSVNGLSMVVGSVGKAAGPALGANLFAWSVTSGAPFPFDYGFTFYFTALVAIAALGMSYWLPHALNLKFERGVGMAQTCQGGRGEEQMLDCSDDTMEDGQVLDDAVDSASAGLDTARSTGASDSSV
jgi:MFS family permease